MAKEKFDRTRPHVNFGTIGHINLWDFHLRHYAHVYCLGHADYAQRCGNDHARCQCSHRSRTYSTIHGRGIALCHQKNAGERRVQVLSEK